MKILIVAATFAEIKPILKKAVISETYNDSFSCYVINGKEIDVLITGIGMVSTAYHMGRILANNSYDVALNFGIAGAFSRNISLAEVVNVENDSLSELGAEHGNDFLKFDQLEIGTSSMTRTMWTCKNNFEINNETIQQLPRMKGITVNTIHGNWDSIKKVRELFNPDIETMEGAAFLAICNSEKIKCAQVRSISNYVEERNRDIWEIVPAIKSLNEVAFKILKTI